jgi:hypothetical protein
MLYLMEKSNMIISPARAIERLAREHPEWLPVLEAAAAVAAEVDDGEFAGAWVVDELGRRGLRRWIPNLRILVSYGLLEKSGPSTRGGRRAYYQMPNRVEVEQALESRRAREVESGPRTLQFIASGASNDEQVDTGRRAGEIAYEPRSWR